LAALFITGVVLLRRFTFELYRCAALLDLLLCASFFFAQTGPTAIPAQTPKTAPQIQQVLPSYEGQNVSSVELAGHPEMDMGPLLPLLVQKQDEPFSQAKVDATVAALKSTHRFNDVQIQIRPEPKACVSCLCLSPRFTLACTSFPERKSAFLTLGYCRSLTILRAGLIHPWTW